MKFNLVIFILLICNGCKKDDFVVKELELPPFNLIYVSDIFNIELKPDVTGNFKSVIITENEQFDRLECVVKNDTLFLGLSDGFGTKLNRDKTNITIFFHPDSLWKIHLTAPCFLFSNDTIKTNSLIIWGITDINEVNLKIKSHYLFYGTKFTAFGKVRFEGNVDSAEFHTHGALRLDALNLECNKLYLIQMSISDCYINVSDHLYVSLLQPGNVYLAKEVNFIDTLEVSSDSQILIYP